MMHASPVDREASPANLGRKIVILYVHRSSSTLQNCKDIVGPLLLVAFGET